MAKNKVFIATSIDGYIADRNGGIDWLHTITNPENDDMGYSEFTSEIDAIVMGRTTFETVCGFDIEWPFQKPVFVLSNSITTLPEKLYGKEIEILNGSIKNILNIIHQKGFQQLYIDGGKTIQAFLKEDLIDEMTITIIPILLGGGYPLFSEQSEIINFKCNYSKIFLDMIVQNRFSRNKST